MGIKSNKNFSNKMSHSVDNVKSTALTPKDNPSSVGVTVDNIKSISSRIGKSAGILTIKAGKTLGTTLLKAGDTAVSVGNASIDKIKQIDFNNYKFDVEDVLRQVMRIPGVRINRSKFLRKELMPYHSENTINTAINKNPAYAGIEKKEINIIANEVINYETNRVTTVSFIAGIPGGMAMFATIPGDVLQYFVHIVISMQKLAYLYGFEDFELSDYSINDDIFNQIMIFLGVMFGVQGANTGVKIIADSAAKKLIKTLPQKALTKGMIYPIVKNVSKFVGIKMTKDIFAKNLSKIVPVIGGVVSGSITYAMFKPGCRRLQKSFNQLKLSNPEFYNDIS